MEKSNAVKLWLKKLRNRWAAFAAVGITAVSAVGCASGNTEKTKDKKVDKQEQVVKVKSPVKQIKYVTDTISQTSGRALLYYNKQVIIRNFIDKDNTYKMDLPLFSHEDWHAHNDEINLRLTPFEYYKSRIHNEISANIAGLLTARYQYMVTKDKKAFAQKYEGKMFGFYFDAVLKGKIKPESNNPKKLEREYKFIANGMQKAWMERFYKWYVPSFYDMLQRYVKRNGWVNKSNKNYYAHTLKHMYNIGGIDFSKYFKHDVLPSDGRVMITDGLSEVKSISGDGTDIINYINEGYALFEDIGIEKQIEAFQHLLIASKLKYAMRSVTAEEIQDKPQLTNMYYRQIISKIQKDVMFEDFVNKYPTIDEHRCVVKTTDMREYKKIISSIYTFKGIDLSKNIQDFKIEKVPVKTPDFNGFDFTDNNYYWMPVSAIYGENSHNKYYGLIISETNNELSKPKGKIRRSNQQFIVAPDYSEPILISADKEDKKRILEVIKDFENMPEVLKECDTEAQKKYYASLEKAKEKQNRQQQKKNISVRKLNRQKTR